MTESVEMKTCRKCGISKLLTEFYIMSNGNPRLDCKKCVNRHDAEHRGKNSKAYKQARENIERRVPYGMKICSKCDLIKPLDEFYKSADCRDGYRPDCKECVKERSRIWLAEHPEQAAETSRVYREDNAEALREKRHADYIANPEPTKERARAWAEANPERVHERNVNYYRANSERIIENTRAWREANPERVKEKRRAEYAANSEYFKENARAWYAANPERARETRRIYVENNREIINAASARGRQRRRLRIIINMTSEDRELSAAYRKAIRDDPCFYCGEWSDTMHYDHIVPLSQEGTDHWWNLVRACADCNLRKGTKTAEEFMEEESKK